MDGSSERTYINLDVDHIIPQRVGVLTSWVRNNGVALTKHWRFFSAKMAER